MIKRLQVKEIPTMKWMNDVANELVKKFNMSDNELYLDVFENYQDSTVDEILEEGMYDYSFKYEDEISNEILEMLDEVSYLPYFISFEPSDVNVM